MSTTVLAFPLHEHITLNENRVVPRTHKPIPHRRRILLNTRNTLFLLCPLLPTSTPKHALAIPEEVWRCILEYVMDDLASHPNVPAQSAILRRDILRTCKTFKYAASPLLYASPILFSQSALLAFRDTLVSADRRWDELRRIHFSTPGRWVVSLDISALAPESIKSRLAVDTALTQIFPLTPFLADLKLHPKVILSRRALKALQESCGTRLRRVTGLGIPDVASSSLSSLLKDPVTDLLACSPNLKELHIVGGGFGDFDFDDEVEGAEAESPSSTSPTRENAPLPLQHLHTLTLIAIPLSPAFVSLLNTSLPTLTSLTMTSYHSELPDEQVLAAHALGLPVPDGGGPGLIGGFPGPQSLLPNTPSTALFLKQHGMHLESLTLLSAPDWPPIPFTPPRDLLISCPRLERLSILAEKNGGSAMGSPVLRLDLPDAPHPLTEIHLSRPNEDLLASLDTALRANALLPPSPTMRGSGKLPNRACPIANTRRTSFLPAFTTVKFVSVRWLKLTSHGALNAGTSGGMRHWKTTLRRFGVKVLDMDGAEA